MTRDIGQRRTTEQQRADTMAPPFDQRIGPPIFDGCAQRDSTSID
ncbi:hypothetical protein [Burkholderia thailandensis]|nr:hypothetical protein [Burkholderia thailandensis]